ncbi:MAG: tyrosine-type recombinase/integrase [candidate division Zixibacteria bacterium]|nr:tyrosine-type recombinase/integrase [Candidatus Tariuqbacter arcticus]
MKLTLSQLIELFSEFLKNCYAPNTAVSYLRDIRDFHRFIIDYLGVDSPRINQLDRLSVRHYIARLHLDGKKSSTINRRIASLNCFFEFLRRRQIIPKNPLHGIPRPKKKQGLPPFIGEKKLGRLLDELPAGTPSEKRDRAIMELFYGGGIRLAELIALKVQDFEGGSFLRVMGKGSKERLIPLGSRAVNALQDYLKSRETISARIKSQVLFINSRGSPLDKRYVQREVKSLLSGIRSDLSPHILRHAFATHMMRNGADLRAIQELLGHQNLTATQIYTHFCPQDLKEIFSRTHPRA